MFRPKREKKKKKQSLQTPTFFLPSLLSFSLVSSRPSTTFSPSAHGLVGIFLLFLALSGSRQVLCVYRGPYLVVCSELDRVHYMYVLENQSHQVLLIRSKLDKVPAWVCQLKYLFAPSLCVAQFISSSSSSAGAGRGRGRGHVSNS